MRSTRLTRLIIVGLALLLSSCSSGGDGGGGGSSASTGVRLLHGSLDAAALDVLSTARPGEVVQRAHFGATTIYDALPTGVQDLNVTVAKRGASSEFRFSGINVQKNERRSIAVYGDDELLGVDAALLTDAFPEVGDSDVVVRVFHAVVRASEISLRIGGQDVLTSVPYGTASSYVIVPASELPQTLEISRVTDGAVLFSGPMLFSSGRAYTLLAAGEVDYFVTLKMFEDS